MIMRILGEGQYRISEGHLEQLNDLDAVLQSAADAGDNVAFGAALRALLDMVRDLGTPLPADELAPSDLVLPEEGTTVAQVRELLSGEGLIPG